MMGKWKGEVHGLGGGLDVGGARLVVVMPTVDLVSGPGRNWRGSEVRLLDI
jgi:hypothetical protein